LCGKHFRRRKGEKERGHRVEIQEEEKQKIRDLRDKESQSLRCREQEFRIRP
jgi:hypothetical protein